MAIKRICVLGLGYIGLPTAAMFATHGYTIIGVDVKDDIVNALNNGQITISEPYLDILVHAAVTSGNLVGRTRPEEADVFIIAVPTPITHDKKADMSYVVRATESIVPFLKEGDIVILESTSPTGTVNNIMAPILERSGLKAGEQFYLAHSPERVLPGRILIELVENNRIVGGINQKSAELVKDLYKTFVKGQIYLTDSTTAELCKMMENTFRDVNIALANELAMVCEKIGVNAWEVIDLCNRHPRVNIHQPGPGVGGHCLAVDPWFIVEKFPEEAKIISLARETNDSMPEHVLNRTEEILKDIEGNKTITILGITYKPDIDDIRESPILHLINLLEKAGTYHIRVVDPYAGLEKYPSMELISACSGSDLLILGVNHKEFAKIDFHEAYKAMRHKNFFDTRNAISRDLLENIGFSYHLLGQS